MTRILRKRFIRSAMLAVTLVMVIFLIAINALNAYTMKRDTEKTVRLILTDSMAVQMDGGPGGPGAGLSPAGNADMPGPPEGNADMSVPPDSAPDAPDEAGGDLEKPDRVPDEALISEQYFFVRLTSEGQAIDTGLTHIAALDEDQAVSYAKEAAGTGLLEGRLDRYYFRKIQDMGEDTSRFLFLDTSQQQRAVMRTFFVTAAVGGVTWLLMLLLVIFLSRKAIEPIAKNIERQKQFVTDAGHEIKTPLAIIQANADVLELHTGSNKWIDHIREQVSRLSDLTRNMLMLSRMEEGSLSGEPPVTFDAGAVLHETLKTFRESAEVRGIRITEETAQGVMLTMQRDAFANLLSILFENAVKYTDEGGRIRVTLVREGKDAVICEENTCAAVPEGDPDRLFDRFYRADKARTQKQGGSGIGLSVARAITEQAGGSIRADCPDDRTIRFTVRLRGKGSR